MTARKEIKLKPRSAIPINAKKDAPYIIYNDRFVRRYSAVDKRTNNKPPIKKKLFASNSASCGNFDSKYSYCVETGGKIANPQIVIPATSVINASVK